MRDRAPSIVAVILLVVLVLGTWWAADYARNSIPIDPPPRVTHDANSWAKDFVMVRTDEKGVAINRLEGNYLQHYPDDGSYQITTVTATGQQPDTPLTVGTARTATMNKSGTEIVMKGDAHIHRAADGKHNVLDVTSEELTLLPDKDVVYTDLPALVVNGDSTMHGTGMRYDNKTSVLQVYSSSDVKISGKDTAGKKPSGSDEQKTTEQSGTRQ
jgi:lipopolysaccharide export system protein LptC